MVDNGRAAVNMHVEGRADALAVQAVVALGVVVAVVARRVVWLARVRALPKDARRLLLALVGHGARHQVAPAVARGLVVDAVADDAGAGCLGCCVEQLVPRQVKRRGSGVVDGQARRR